MTPWQYYRFVARYLALTRFRRPLVGDLAERMAARHGRRPFCLFEEERLSFAAFNRAANRRANALRAMGVGPGDVVAVMMENRPEYLATLIGLAKLGAVAATFSTHLHGPAIAHCVRTAGAGRVIVGAECLPRFNEAVPRLPDLPPKRILVDTRWPADAAPPAGSEDLGALLEAAGEANPPRPDISGRAPLMYVFTSGTTGLPKAARITHLRWIGAGLMMGHYALGLGPGDVIYCPLPLYHTNASMGTFGAALLNGATMALARRFSASRFWDDVRRHGATSFIYVGEVLRYLVNRPPDPRDRDHRVTRVIGNGLRPEIWRTFQERFGIPHVREFYSSTEGNATTVNVDDVVGSVGKPALRHRDNLVLVRYDPHTGEHVRGEDGFVQRCRTGEVGELLGEITPKTPFGGYTDPEATERKRLRNVLRAGDAYYRTGDLMRQDDRGHYYFVDRIGDTFRWKGENVSTQEVQETLTRFPGVAFANVYGVPVPGTEGRAGMAALALEDGAGFDPEGFGRFVTETLPHYACPVFVRLPAELEMTGTFKLRKTRLQEEGFDPAVVSDPLYYLHREQGTYVPLDSAGHERIVSGAVRF